MKTPTDTRADAPIVPPPPLSQEPHCTTDTHPAVGADVALVLVHELARPEVCRARRAREPASAHHLPAFPKPETALPAVLRTSAIPPAPAPPPPKAARCPMQHRAAPPPPQDHGTAHPGTANSTPATASPPPRARARPSSCAPPPPPPPSRSRSAAARGAALRWKLPTRCRRRRRRLRRPPSSPPLPPR